MAIEVKIPSPGESVTEVTIASWLKSDGDFVEQDEELLEIESDKATLSVAAESDGVLKILLEEGATANVGDIAATIDSVAKAKPAPSTDSDSMQPAEAKPKPEPSYSNKQAADPQPATTGTGKSRREADSTYATGTPSPAAKKLMEEHGLSAGQINGSGKDGRITKADVLEKVEAPSKNGAPAEQPEARPRKDQPAPASEPVRMISGTRSERREAMSKLRQRVSQRLVAVKNETAMLTTFNEVDMTAILKLRKEYKETFEKEHGIRLGFMSLFTKAVTEALRSFPAINAFIDGDDVVYHDYVDIAIAVQAPKGLVVPVIRNAESMTLDEIEKEVARLAHRARNNQLTIDEMTGGTFTISNGGVFGSLMSTPILNPPQSGILGMHKIEERPIAVNGEVVIRPMMYVAFSYDHRIIDGRESVGFLVRVKEFLENPVRMLLRV